MIAICRRYKDPKIRKLENCSTTVDVWICLLVPISHATTATGRGAYCFFLDVSD